MEVISNGIGPLETASLLDEKEFTIYIDSDPEPVVTWLKDGEQLDNRYISSKTTHVEGLRYFTTLLFIIVHYCGCPNSGKHCTF